MPLLAAASLLFVAACAATAPKTAVSNHGAPRGLDTTIRTVDFQNFTYEDVTVKDGEYERPKDADGDSQGFFSAGKPVYGDVDGDNVEDAIVITIDNSGGTGMFDAARVYMMRNGAPVQVAAVPGGDRGDGGLRDVTVEPGGLIVERFLSGDGDGACCPSQITVEHWRWTGKDLAIDEQRSKTIPNPDHDN
ncbi:MAG TPA: hypothetical protein VL463_21050 [Kofleriaceae bacterium]|nr:hypothetical protein [Kofleriaceae bacterium]